MEMRGKHSWCLVMLILHYVQEVSYFKNRPVLGEWSVAPTNKCSSEMKAALLPRSYVEKVGQCTWGNNLLLLCSHPSNSVVIVSMNTFKLVAVSQQSPTNMPWPLHRVWFLREMIIQEMFLWGSWILVHHLLQSTKKNKHFPLSHG